MKWLLWVYIVIGLVIFTALLVQSWRTSPKSQGAFRNAFISLAIASTLGVFWPLAFLSFPVVIWLNRSTWSTPRPELSVAALESIKTGQPAADSSLRVELEPITHGADLPLTAELSAVLSIMQSDPERYWSSLAVKAAQTDKNGFYPTALPYLHQLCRRGLVERVTETLTMNEAQRLGLVEANPTRFWFRLTETGKSLVVGPEGQAQDERVTLRLVFTLVSAVAASVVGLILVYVSPIKLLLPNFPDVSTPQSIAFPVKVVHFLSDLPGLGPVIHKAVEDPSFGLFGGMSLVLVSLMIVRHEMAKAIK